MSKEANLEIVKRVNDAYFVPETPEDQEYFLGEWGALTFMARHKVSGEYAEIEYLRDLPRNRRFLSESLSLPAIRIYRAGNLLTSPYGLVSRAIVGENSENEFYVYNDYYFDFEGNGEKLESVAIGDPIDKLTDEELVEVRKLGQPVSEESRWVSLDPEDYNYIRGLLDSLDLGEFEDGEYSADIGDYS